MVSLILSLFADIISSTENVLEWDEANNVNNDKMFIFLDELSF